MASDYQLVLVDGISGLAGSKGSHTSVSNELLESVGDIEKCGSVICQDGGYSN